MAARNRKKSEEEEQKQEQEESYSYRRGCLAYFLYIGVETHDL